MSVCGKSSRSRFITDDKTVLAHGGSPYWLPIRMILESLVETGTQSSVFDWSFSVEFSAESYILRRVIVPLGTTEGSGASDNSTFRYPFPALRAPAKKALDSHAPHRRSQDLLQRKHSALDYARLGLRDAVLFKDLSTIR